MIYWKISVAAVNADSWLLPSLGASRWASDNPSIIRMASLEQAIYVSPTVTTKINSSKVMVMVSDRPVNLEG